MHLNVFMSAMYNISSVETNYLAPSFAGAIEENRISLLHSPANRLESGYLGDHVRQLGRS